MTGSSGDEESARLNRYIQRSEAKQAQLYDERAGLLKWCVGASVAANSGAVALVASREGPALASQIALTCFLASIILTIIAGWQSGRSAHSESTAYRLAIAITDGARTPELEQERVDQWQISSAQDGIAALAAALALLFLLVGGLTAIWCPA